MSTKVTYIISNIDKAIAFEWIVEKIDREKIELSFILLNPKPSYLFRYLEEHQIEAYELPYRGKKDLPLTTLKCVRLLHKIRPAAVHCHLFDANMAGLTAAWTLGIRKRIYTRHHSTFHHDYFPKAVRWDRYCNNKATHIVAISKTVWDVLVNLESVPPARITTIYHGFELGDFAEKKYDNIRRLGEKYNAEGKRPVIGVISRFVNWKGIQYIIPAFEKLLRSHPGALLLLFNARGDYEQPIDALLERLPAGSYKKIPFENDVTSLYHLFDLMLHVPVSAHAEAFGQTYIESMAAGVPLIATMSGIGNEIMRDRENAVVVSHQDAEAIYKAMEEVLGNDRLRDSLVKEAFATVNENFTVEKMVRQLESLYLR